MTLTQIVVLHQAALLEAVHSQQRQSVVGSLLCKCKDVKLPVAARILQTSHFPECSFETFQTDISLAGNCSVYVLFTSCTSALTT